MGAERIDYSSDAEFEQARLMEEDEERRYWEKSQEQELEWERLSHQMKIDLSSINREHFRVEQHFIGGEPVYLVNPNELCIPWTEDTVIFRSSVWAEDGTPVSLSFKKFFNWGEQDELFPVPDPSEDCEFYTKVDGSLLAVSKWHGHLVIRTRGTVDATLQPNGNEIPLLMKKYPKAFEFDDDTSDHTRIFEWTTPTNKIILDYGPEPKLCLIGRVDHLDYSYMTQEHLDLYSLEIDVPRPEKHRFGSLSEMLEKVKQFDGVEGVCVYSRNGQCIHKVKGLKYLMMHRFKSNASPKSILELFIEQGYPGRDDFEKFFVDKFDFECFEYVRELADRVCSLFIELKAEIDGACTWVDTIMHLTRKDAAEMIKTRYGGTELQPVAFVRLSGKDAMDAKMIRKMLMTRLKIQE